MNGTLDLLRNNIALIENIKGLLGIIYCHNLVMESKVMSVRNTLDEMLYSTTLYLGILESELMEKK